MWLLLVSSVGALAVVGAEIIPPERRMDWSPGVNAGVPGGIPDRMTVFVNVLTTTNPLYRCKGDGVSDDSTFLQNALNDCPAHQVVFLPAGTYFMNRSVTAEPRHSNTTLRGAGQGKTIILPAAECPGQAPLHFGNGDWPRPAEGPAITAGAVSGSSTVTVDASTENVTVGTLVRIDPANPGFVHNFNGAGNSSTMTFMFKVLAKTPTTVTFTPPLPMDLSAMRPTLVPYRNPVIEGFGIEDLTIDLSKTRMAGVFGEQSWGCWIRNVEVANSDSRQIFLAHFNAGEIRHCYTHGTRSGGPDHEGIDFYSDSCWNLVEDNIVYNGGFPGIVLGDSRGGCVGNVIAYNYCDAVNVGSNDTGGADISFAHGPHNVLNLLEGNIAGMLQADGYWGSSSHNTIFRNWLTVTHPTAIYGLRAIDLCHCSTDFNVVGNILGTTNFTGEYSTEVNSYNNDIKLIYRMGYPFMGNTFFNGTFGPTTPPDYTSMSNKLTEAPQLDLNVKV